MVFTPFDFNEASRQREDFVEDRLREGSPIVGISYEGGLMLLTVRQSQRKVFEVYDRLIVSAIGKQADIESIRTGSIDFAHKEGYELSPDDVTVQRLVGFFLSPALKRIFGDLSSSPAVFRGVFGELGRTPADDLYFVLGYDGEFTISHGSAVVAGTVEAEERMQEKLGEPDPAASRDEALRRALDAWAAGQLAVRRDRTDHADEDGAADAAEDTASVLRDALKTGHLEVGLLDRKTPRESRFRLLSEAELQAVRSEFE